MGKEPSNLRPCVIPSCSKKTLLGFSEYLQSAARLLCRTPAKTHHRRERRAEVKLCSRVLDARENNDRGSSCPHHENRDLRMGENVARHAAENRLPEGATAEGADQ